MVHCVLDFNQNCALFSIHEYLCLKIASLFIQHQKKLTPSFHSHIFSFCIKDEKNKFPLERRIRGSPSIQRMTLEPECDIKLSDTKYDIQICMPLKFDTLKSERQKPGALETCLKLIRLFFILTVGYFLFFLLIF